MTILVLVSVVGANVNSTSSDVTLSKSRMWWLKNFLDHHYWMEILENVSIPEQCDADLRTYLAALKDGQLWASKSKYNVVYRRSTLTYLRSTCLLWRHYWYVKFWQSRLRGDRFGEKGFTETNPTAQILFSTSVHHPRQTNNLE